MSVLRACLDQRVLLALAAIAGLVALLAPQFLLAVIPLLVVAACPLSMIVMMATMRHGAAGGSQSRMRTAGEVRRELAELSARRTGLESELAALEREAGPGDGVRSSVGR